MQNIFSKEKSEVVRLINPGRTNYIMIDPSKTNTKQFTMGITEVDAGSYIPDHVHNNEEEIMFCYEGEGTVTVEGNSYPFKRGVTAYVPRGANHSFNNPGKEKLAYTFTYSPPGFEKVIREKARLQNEGKK